MAGETTTLPAAERGIGKQIPNAGLTKQILTKAFSTTQNETADVMEMGYLPPHVTVIGIEYRPDDMDSATALVQKITIGTTDVATGLTGGQTGTSSYQQVKPPLALPENSKTLIKVTSTTAAGTPVAGNLTLIVEYHQSP